MGLPPALINGPQRKPSQARKCHHAGGESAAGRKVSRSSTCLEKNFQPPGVRPKPGLDASEVPCQPVTTSRSVTWDSGGKPRPVARRPDGVQRRHHHVGAVVEGTLARPAPLKNARSGVEPAASAQAAVDQNTHRWNASTKAQLSTEETSIPAAAGRRTERQVRRPHLDPPRRAAMCELTISSGTTPGSDASRRTESR